MGETNLDTLHVDVFLEIAKYVSLLDKKMLRLVSSKVKFAVDSEPKSPFLNHTFTKMICTTQMFKFCQEVKVIKELSFMCGCNVDWRDFLKFLINQHPELERLSLSLSGETCSFSIPEFQLVQVLKITSSKLVKLRLMSCLEIDAEAFQNIALPHLSILHLLSCWNIPDDVLVRYLSSTDGGSLATLLVGSTQLSGEGFQVEKEKLESLKVLHLQFCDNITNNGLKNIINATGGYLVELDLRGLPLSTESLTFPKDKLHHLQILNLENCVRLTDSGLVNMVNATGGRLVRLNVADTNVTGELVGVAKDKLHRLQNLNVASVKTLTSAGLRRLVNLTGGLLVYLNLSGTVLSNGLPSVEERRLHHLEVLTLHDARFETDSDELSTWINSTGGYLKELDLRRTSYSSKLVHIDGGKQIVVLQRFGINASLLSNVSILA